MLNVMPIQLIVNADDFGCSTSVNAAVAQAHTFGTLTSASLMVTGEAAGEAAAIAGDHPNLAVGLHLTLSRARSILPGNAIPNLVDMRGRFSDDPIAASLKYYFSAAARRQLASEIEAQFEAFVRLGIPMSHVDGHQHLHAHPVVLPIVIRLAQEYGAHGIRVPREPKALRGFGQAYLAWKCRRLLRNSALARCDYCIGGLMSGRMNPDYIIDVLDRLPAKTVEAYFHPSTQPSREALGPNPGDLATLLDPRFRDYIAAHCQLATYESLSREAIR